MSIVHSVKRKTFHPSISDVIATVITATTGITEGTLHGTCRNYPDTGKFTERFCVANNFFHQQSIYLSTITGKPRRTRDTPVIYRLFTDKCTDDARLLFFGQWWCRNRFAPNTSFFTVCSLFRALPPPR